MDSLTCDCPRLLARLLSHHWVGGLPHTQRYLRLHQIPVWPGGVHPLVVLVGPQKGTGSSGSAVFYLAVNFLFDRWSFP